MEENTGNLMCVLCQSKTMCFACYPRYLARSALVYICALPF